MSISEADFTMCVDERCTIVTSASFSQSAPQMSNAELFNRPPHRPRPLVERSWSRVLGLGLDPGHANIRDPLPPGEVERLRRASGLAPVAADLLRIAQDAAFLLVVTDA